MNIKEHIRGRRPFQVDSLLLDAAERAAKVFEEEMKDDEELRITQLIKNAKIQR